MKNLVIILLLSTGFTAQSQNILRVNNTPGINAPYTTIAAAVAAAGPTDIIMLEGSLSDYGSVTINKKVTLTGPGYYLAENPGFQASLFPAKVRTITLNSGAEGSTFTGLFMAYHGLQFVINSVSDIKIMNCFIEGCNGSGGGGIELSGSGSNLLIQGNYFTGGCEGINIYGTYSSVIVTNNVLRNTSSGSLSTLCSFANNIFYTNPILQNSFISNNIFKGGGITNATGSIIKNNQFYSASQPGADATNYFNATDAILFVGTGYDTYWKLKAGSPAIGAGEGGVDCGIYGGASPYRPSGIRSGQPTITDFSTPSTVTQNGTLTVKVSAKVN